MNKKNGTAGTPVEPIAPIKAIEADVADPGEVSELKAQQRQQQTGKYGSTKVKPFRPPSEDGGAATASTAASEEEKEKKQSWIEIELLGEDDQPIPGERYRVTLPDGSVDEGTLDPKGWARIEGFAPGECQVSFPELDGEAVEPIKSLGPRPPA